MRTRAQSLGLAAAIGLAMALGQSIPAFAGEPGPDTLPINVVAVQTGDAYDQAEALTKALRNALKAVPGWSLGEGDFSLEVLSLSLKCGDVPDASCQSRIADQIKTDRYVWGIVSKKGGNISGHIHLWVRGQGTTDAPLEYSANLTESNDEALKKVASDAIQALTGGPPKGSIHVKAGDVAGQVFIDDQPVGALVNGEGTFSVPSGPHKVLVKAQGHDDAEAQVIVKPTGVADVSLTLGKTEVKTPTNWKRIGGFIGIGAGVAFGAVGVVSSLQVNSAQNNDEFKRYAGQYSSGVNICDQSKTPTVDPKEPNPTVADLCDKAGTFTVMQFIFYPLAAVAAGAGIYLLVTSGDDSPAPTTGWTFQPVVGKESGHLNATYRW